MSKKVISRKDRVIQFAGVFMGEGCISAYLDGVAKHGKTLDVKMKVANTDLEIIKGLSETLVENRIGFYYALNGNAVPALEIAVSGQVRVERLIKLIRPYLWGSKGIQADKMLELIHYRQSLGYKPASNTVSLLDDPRILSLVEEIASLKKHRIDPLKCSRVANTVLGIPIDYTLNTAIAAKI
jgi:hypothetical protein